MINDYLPDVAGARDLHARHLERLPRAASPPGW